MDRRSFLKYSSASIPTFFIARSHFTAENTEERIAFLGTDTKNKTFGSVYDNKPNESTYIELNPNTGKVVQTLVPIKNGHSVLPFSNDSNLVVLCPYLGDLAAVFDRKKKTVVERLSSPEGFVFSGHCEQAGDRLFFPLKSTPFKHDNDRPGKLLVLKKKSLKNPSYIDTPGLWPHDVSIDKDVLAITHAGTNGPLPQATEYLYDNSNANVCIISHTSKKLLKRLDMPGASPSHITYSKKTSRFFFNSVQWLNPSGERVRAMQSREGFRLSMSEKMNRRISSSDPLFALDFKNTRIQKIPLPADKTRRAVEILVDDFRNCFYASFSHSDSLFKLDFNGKILGTIGAFDIGISEIRGLAFLGKKYLVASSKYRGIVLLDRDSLELISRYDVTTYGNTHISVI